MTPYLEDADCTLWHGDALDVLAELPAESVDCVVTSPPYWGLRDYGTGAWEGGDEGCDHLVPAGGPKRGLNSDGHNIKYEVSVKPAGNVCPKCGARRVDNQLGLEPTPDQYVARMVAVFREVRRVLCAHGTCWVNLGDSYAASSATGHGGWDGNNKNPDGSPRQNRQSGDPWSRTPTAVAGLKPKDLVGIPWRVAFALQADGWWLRSDIVWAKPNPMPESVTDRPTKSHEYVFLLTKQPRYWFDAEAVREGWSESTLRIHGNPGVQRRAGEWKSEHVGQGHAGLGNGLSRGGPRHPPPQDETLDGSDGEAPRGPDGRRVTHVEAGDGSIQHRDGERWPNAGRNVRSVWTIATQPYPEAHFATYPEELVRRCVLAGCPERVCRVCGKPAERETVETAEYAAWKQREAGWAKRSGDLELGRGTAGTGTNSATVPPKFDTVGWSDCGHNNWRPGQVLDPFVGSGTTCKVARDHGRHSIGIDLSADYLALAATRLQQLSLLTGEAHASQ